MFHTTDQELQAVQAELRTTQAELSELKEQLRHFEAQVDARLGSLLDQLLELNAETSILDGQLRHIREERLFGSDLMQYLDGAPQPSRPIQLETLPPAGLPTRTSAAVQAGSMPNPPTDLPDIKALYRKLARRYHPDLARSDADRALSNDHMKEINQAYANSDLPALMRLAGMSIPYGAVPKSSPPPITGIPKKSLSELEQAQRDLREARQQLNLLSSLPIVKLSLDVKLARHQGRDLLREMTGELSYKIARKTAQRDYLQSQIKAAQAQNNA